MVYTPYFGRFCCSLLAVFEFAKAIISFLLYQTVLQVILEKFLDVPMYNLIKRQINFLLFLISRLQILTHFFPCAYSSVCVRFAEKFNIFLTVLVANEAAFFTLE